MFVHDLKGTPLHLTAEVAYTLLGFFFCSLAECVGGIRGV
jgi:hypothetical protein